MRSIRVERTIAAPIDGVFEVLTDHANYARFGGIRRAELVREGQSEPNGVGALRRVLIGPFTFEEEVTAFERPTRLDYLIVKVNTPFQHEGGSIRLAEATSGEGTLAIWTSSFTIPIPVVGGVVERFWGAALGRGFAGTLETAGKLAKDSPAPG